MYPFRANLDLVSPENPAEGLISQVEWHVLGDSFGLSEREWTGAELLFTEKIGNKLL